MQCLQPVLRLGLNMFDLVLFWPVQLVTLLRNDSHLLPNQFSQLNFGKTNLRSGSWQFGGSPDYCIAGARWARGRGPAWGPDGPWAGKWTSNFSSAGVLTKVPVGLPHSDILWPISVWSRKEVERTSEHPAKMSVLYQPKIGHWNWNSNLAAVTPFSLSSEHNAAAICCTCFSVFSKECSHFAALWVRCQNSEVVEWAFCHQRTALNVIAAVLCSSAGPWILSVGKAPGQNYMLTLPVKKVPISVNGASTVLICLFHLAGVHFKIFKKHLLDCAPVYLSEHRVCNLAACCCCVGTWACADSQGFFSHNHLLKSFVVLLLHRPQVKINMLLDEIYS